jgi:hypothetical protein
MTEDLLKLLNHHLMISSSSSLSTNGRCWEKITLREGRLARGRIRKAKGDDQSRRRSLFEECLFQQFLNHQKLGNLEEGQTFSDGNETRFT